MAAQINVNESVKRGLRAEVNDVVVEQVLVQFDGQPANVVEQYDDCQHFDDLVKICRVLRKGKLNSNLQAIHYLYAIFYVCRLLQHLRNSQLSAISAAEGFDFGQIQSRGAAASWPGGAACRGNSCSSYQHCATTATTCSRWCCYANNHVRKLSAKSAKIKLNGTK